MGDIFKLGTPPLELVVRTVLIYLVFLAALRLFGKREIGQFTIFDLALVLLAANALQPAITGPDSSVTGAAIIIATIFVINWVMGQLRSRYAPIRRFLEDEPTVIGRDGSWIRRAVEDEGLDDVDLQAALREHGLAEVSQMKLAVLEEDGSISIVASDDGETARTRRRRRFRRHQNA